MRVTSAALNALFTPHAIAVVGASRDPRKLGYIILDNLIRGGFQGTISPVNSDADIVLGRRAYKSVQEIPGAVDLAVIVVPATAVCDVIDDCGRKAIPAAVVISAGFRETGDAGRELESKLIEHARAAEVRFVGPNSVGIINTFAKLNATFAEAQPLSYEVALVSQSGAVATAILDWARSIGVGFSKFVSLGNMADVSEVELLEHLANDPETRVIVAYLEGFSAGRSFVDTARKVTARKPIVAMKVGTSSAGARAAASHTGALAASDAIVDGAFRQSGIIRARTMDELFDLTLGFSFLAPPAGPRIAIVTNAGGPGVMAADAVERYGLELACLADDTVACLRDTLPVAAAVRNPIDVLGDARSGRYKSALEVVIGDPGVDAAVVMLTPQAISDPDQTARTIAHIARSQRKPVIAVYMGGEAVTSGRTILDLARVPTYPYPERAIRTLAAMYRYRSYLQDL